MKLTVKDTCFRDISDCSCFYNVSDDKLLNGLVLGDTASTVGAADRLDMAPAFLGTAVVPSLLSLFTRANIYKIAENKQPIMTIPETNYQHPENCVM